jgi:hypothetical protein
MPLPALLGAGVVGAVAGTALTKVIDFGAKFFTKRTAINVGIFVVIVGMMATFVAVLESILFGLSVVMPPEYGQAMGLIIPANFKLCLGAIYGCRTAHYAYMWYKRVVELNIQSSML